MSNAAIRVTTPPKSDDKGFMVERPKDEAYKPASDETTTIFVLRPGGLSFGLDDFDGKGKRVIVDLLAGPNHVPAEVAAALAEDPRFQRALRSWDATLNVPDPEDPASVDRIRQAFKALVLRAKPGTRAAESILELLELLKPTDPHRNDPAYEQRKALYREIRSFVEKARLHDEAAA